jgi:hypothetical protein
LGVIYSKCDAAADEGSNSTLDDLSQISSVIKEFQFFAQPKFRIASSRPGSGNTKNIGSVIKFEELILKYKERGGDALRAHEKEIANLAEDEAAKTEEEND